MPKTYRTEIIGYKFGELSENIQQDIYGNDEYFSHSVDFDPIERDFRELMIDHFGAVLGTLEVYYDVSYSQGSGACCVAELDVDTVFANCVGTYFAKLLGLINSGRVEIDAINIVRCGPSNFYNHENTCQVEIEYTCDSNEVGDWEGEDITELEEMLTNAIREELCELHNNLRDHYEESTSFETYCEVMSESDTVYTEDGKVVDPAFIRHAYVSDAVQLKLAFDDYEYE